MSCWRRVRCCKDFKAVKEGNVWCTDKESVPGNDMVLGDYDLWISIRMLTEDDPDLTQLTYLYRLTDTK